LFNDSLVNNREIEDKLLIINKNIFSSNPILNGVNGGIFSSPILNGVPNNKLFVKKSSGEQSENSTV
jgi:hypothetical protein